MRIMGFSEHWKKLEQDAFTTFRYANRDWQVGEQVQVYFKPRSKEREFLGIAEITDKLPLTFRYIMEWEAVADGFHNIVEMWSFLKKPPIDKPINKLTLKWIRSADDEVQGSSMTESEVR